MVKEWARIKKLIYVPDGKMNNWCEGIWSKAVMLCWKFFAMTSFGTWLSQSVT
jgi:hypothetical protein